MQAKAGFIVRAMRQEDLPQAFGLSLGEGWNQTLKDWQLLLDNPDNVCIVAEREGNVAGSATAINYANKVAWVGMVLVSKQLRGQGAGKMLLEYILGRLNHIESVKLDATPAGEPLYTNLGFTGEYKIIRMTCERLDFREDRLPDTRMSALTRKNLPDILEHDKIMFGSDRSYLLETLLDYYPGKAYYMEEEKNIKGYILGRDGSRFNYVGPLVATSHDAAEALLSKVLESLNDQPVALDIPEDRKKMITWLESKGFVIQRNFLRMYLKSNASPGITENQYLISGPEFG